jgi:hypothetical protein
LTLIIPGLSDQVGTRMWVMSWEVSSAPMGERRQRSALNESEMVNAVPRLRRGGKTVEGRPVFETPRAEALGESRALRDPSMGGLG